MLKKNERELWEEAVFKDHAYFSVALFRGCGDYQRWEFDHLEEAITCASETEGNGGRFRLLYVVNTAGRSVCLDRADWPKWLELWNEQQKEKK